MYIKPALPASSNGYQASMPPPAPPEPKNPLLKINVLRSLKLHGVGAALITIAVLGAGIGYFIHKGSSYITSASLYVSPVRPMTLTDDREHDYQYESFIQQHMHSVTRYDVLADAIKRMPKGSWQLPNETEQAAVQRLQMALDVARVGITYQMTITLHGRSPNHLADIVNAVAETYVDKAKGEEYYGRDERLQTLRQERARLQTDLDSKLQEQAEITRALGVATVGDNQGSFNTEVDKTRDSYLAARDQRVLAEAQLSSLEHGDSSAPNSSLNAAADDLIAADPGLTAMKANLNQKRASLVIQIGGLTPNNPLRKEAETELAQIDQSLTQMQTDLRKKAAAKVEQKLRTELSRSSIVESKLLSQLQQSTKSATSAAPKLQRADELKNDIETLQKRFAAVDERISNLELESSSPGSVHLFSPALKPLTSEATRKSKFFPMIFLAAIISGLLYAIGRDMLDPRIYSKSDVEDLLGFPPIGVMFDNRQVSLHVYDECILRLAAGIDHAVHLTGVRTFVMTGISRNVGSTTITSGLGTTLAKLGRKTLTIDASGNTNPMAYIATGAPQPADTRPQHVAAAVPDGSSGPLSNSTAIVPQPVSSRVNSLTNFQDDAFRELTDEYDVIVIDAAPILSSAETEYLARFADVTIMVAEAGRTRKNELTRAAKLLERLNVNGVAAILNKVSLARVERSGRQDLKEFESRVNDMNMRWKPVNRTQQHTSVKEERPAQEVKEEDTTSIA